MASSRKRQRDPEIVEDEEINVSRVQVSEFLSAAEKLPDEMYYQVFQYADKKSLAKSRAVCSTWLNAVDDNPTLLKSLVFTIHGIKTFLQSHLASKVISIRIIHPLKGTEQDLEDFFSKIGSTVEQVYLNFVEHFSGITTTRRTERQKLILSMVLRFCTKLNSLTITSEDKNYDFIKDCCEDPRNAIGLSLIQRLSINVRLAYLQELKKFVLSLPNLRFLGLNCEDLGLNLLVDLIMDHLSKYNGNLQEILLKQARKSTSGCLIPLLLLAGERYPATNIKVDSALDLSALLNYEEAENIPINEITCKGITNSYVGFGWWFSTGLSTTKIGFCSNLQSLDLEFLYKMKISPIQFEFMKQLKKLTYLRMKDSSGGCKVPDRECTILSADVFSFGIPSLSTLEFYGGEGLGLNSISFSLCFPNLTKLYIRKFSGELNVHFIFNLTTLDQLRSLTFENVDKLADEHLTRVYDFSAEENGQISNKLPAIAGFKSLKHLHIANCKKLTDKSLKRGLEFCTKLDKITLCSIECCKDEKFTNAGLDSLKKTGNFIVEDLPFCHKKKHVEIVVNKKIRKPFQFKRFTK